MGGGGGGGGDVGGGFFVWCWGGWGGGGGGGGGGDGGGVGGSDKQLCVFYFSKILAQFSFCIFYSSSFSYPLCIFLLDFCTVARTCINLFSNSLSLNDALFNTFQIQELILLRTGKASN